MVAKLSFSTQNRGENVVAPKKIVCARIRKRTALTAKESRQRKLNKGALQSKKEKSTYTRKKENVPSLEKGISNVQNEKDKNNGGALHIRKNRYKWVALPFWD